jgi:hypothetical protein
MTENVGDGVEMDQIRLAGKTDSQFGGVCMCLSVN